MFCIKIDGKTNPADTGTKDQKMYGDTWYALLKKIGLLYTCHHHYLRYIIRINLIK